MTKANLHQDGLTVGPANLTKVKAAKAPAPVAVEEDTQIENIEEAKAQASERRKRRLFSK